MTVICTSIKPLTQSPTKYFSVDGKRWIQWMDSLVDKKLVGPSHIEGSNKWLRVPMDISCGMLTNDIENGTNCKFALDPKLSGTAD